MKHLFFLAHLMLPVGKVRTRVETGKKGRKQYARGPDVSVWKQKRPSSAGRPVYAVLLQAQMSLAMSIWRTVEVVSDLPGDMMRRGL